jgi:hypothetical protein
MLLVPAVASVSMAADRLGPFDTPFEPQAVDRGTRAFLDTIEPAAALIPTLKNAQFGAPDLMAAQTSALAAPFIYVSGEEVLPIGGYTGTSPAPSLAQLKSMIRDGQFHLVLQTRTATDPRLVWIASNCQFLPNSAKAQFVAYFCGAAPGPPEGLNSLHQLWIGVLGYFHFADVGEPGGPGSGRTASPADRDRVPGLYCSSRHAEDTKSRPDGPGRTSGGTAGARAQLPERTVRPNSGAATRPSLLWRSGGRSSPRPWRMGNCPNPERVHSH